MCHIEKVVLRPLQRRKPLVSCKTCRCPQGVDKRRGAAGAACRSKDRRSVVTGKIGIERVDTIDAVAGVELDAHILPHELAEVHRTLAPGLVDIAAGPIQRVAATGTHAPRAGGAEVAHIARGGDLVPEVVVDGFVGPPTRRVAAHNTHQEFTCLPGIVIVAARHNGKIDKKKGIVLVHPHGVEERLRTCRVSGEAPSQLLQGVAAGSKLPPLIQEHIVQRCKQAVGDVARHQESVDDGLQRIAAQTIVVGIHNNTPFGIEHTSQTYRGLIARSDALHAVAQRVGGKVVEACRCAVIDDKTAAYSVAYITDITIGKEVVSVIHIVTLTLDKGIAHQVGHNGAVVHDMVTRGGVAHHIVAEEPCTDTGRPKVKRVACVKAGGVAQLRLGLQRRSEKRKVKNEKEADADKTPNVTGIIYPPVPHFSFLSFLSTMLFTVGDTRQAYTATASSSASTAVFSTASTSNATREG